MQHISSRLGLALISLLVIINTIGVRYMLWKIPESQSRFFISNLRFDFYQYFRGTSLTVFVVLLALAALWYFASDGTKPTYSRSDLLLFLFMGAVLVSYAFSPFKDSAAEGFVETYEGMSTLLSYSALAWLASVFLQNTESRKWIVRVFGGCMAVVTAVSILQSLGHDPINWPLVRFYAQTSMTPYMSPDFRYGATAHGLFSNPNYLSSYYSLFLPFLYAWVLGQKSRIGAGIAWCAAVLCHLALLASHSLSGLLLIALGSGIFLILGSYKLTPTELMRWHGSVLVPIFVAHFADGVAGSGKETAAVAILYTLFWLGRSLAGKFRVSKKRLGLICVGIPAVATVVAALFYQPPSAPLSAFSITENRIYLTLEGARYVLEFGENQIFATGPQKSRVILSDNQAGPVKDSGFPFWLEQRTVLDRDILVLMPFGIRLSENNTSVSYLNAGYQMDQIEQSAIAGPIDFGHWGSSRLHIWQKTLPLIMQRPLWGSGPDTFGLVYPQNDVVNNIRFLSRPYLLVTKAHNSYLNMTVNIGIFGLMCYLAIQYYAVRNLMKFRNNKDYELQTATALILFALVCLVNDSRIYLGIYQWILLGMSFAMIKQQEEDRRQ